MEKTMLKLDIWLGVMADRASNALYAFAHPADLAAMGRRFASSFNMASSSLSIG